MLEILGFMARATVMADRGWPLAVAVVLLGSVFLAHAFGRLAFRRWLTPLRDHALHTVGVCLVHTVHVRFYPVRHGFRYPLFYFKVPLACIDYPTASSKVAGAPLPPTRTTEWWLGPVPIFRCNQPALFAIYTKDYLHAESPANCTLQQALLRALHTKGYQFAPFDHVDLVTTPRVFGYGFNPISFYFCYHAVSRSIPSPQSPKEAALQLCCVVYEVHNTFGEKHIYVMTQSADTPSTPRFPTHTLPRVFHVSPFNDRQGYYRAETHDLRQGSLKVAITYYESPPKLPVFTSDPRVLKESAESLPSRPPKKFVATVAGPAYVLNQWSLVYLAMVYPITAFLTMPRILYQAALLAYRHRMAVYPKPDPMPVNLGKNPPTDTER
ncbi:hypothetical protein H4R35_001638 [Dimargaris xerosporica]|nr:hypothetical protein H4R35_001638 [Dimargaris xerosporica]